jgi:hypothetical protein
MDSLEQFDESKLILIEISDNILTEKELLEFNKLTVKKEFRDYIISVIGELLPN